MIDITLSEPARELADAAMPDVRRAFDEARQRIADGSLGFMTLADNAEHVDAVVAWLATAPAASDVVLIGIGGSALSARVFESLRPDLSAAPRLHVVDTVDPVVVDQLTRDVDPADALLIAVSKSGGTLEMGAVFSVLEVVFRDALGDRASERIAVIAGEEENPLRAHAEAHGYTTFSIPGPVGGRYSALTPVGLLPAALVGVEPARLVDGATDMAEAIQADDSSNPALLLAALHLGAERDARRTHIMWTYGERLRWLGPWWVQLSGESLGKTGADGPVGIVASAATGPADQHSLLQTVLEGPDDRLVVFVSAHGPEGPRVPEGGVSPDFAVGASLGEILDAECYATIQAMEEVGRPCAHIRLQAARSIC